MSTSVIDATGAPTASAEERRGGGAVGLLLVPGVLVVLALFIYPFLYGLFLSFHPMKGGWLANYRAFFADPRLWGTIFTTLKIALPATLINVFGALPVAYKLRRPWKYQRLLTTILVVPITLGTVLVADGLLSYLGPQGWFNRVLMSLDLISGPVHLTHNYWGVMLSLVIVGFPFAFLLLLSFVTGIDPALPNAAATLGAPPGKQFRYVVLPLLAPGLAMTFALSFVQAFSVYPSAVLLGAPAGPTRVISIAAYEAAFENYDYSLGTTIALIMAMVQLIIVAIVLASRSAFYRGPASSGKG
jgi:putative spermidine/putrescine transport system permease protein